MSGLLNSKTDQADDGSGQSTSRPKLPAHLVDSLITSVVESFIADGHVAANLSDEELQKQAMARLKKLVAGESEIALVIDHRESILTNAQSYARARSYEVSCLFYTLWFEHTINGIILPLALRRELTKTEAQEIVRRTGIRDKCTWVLRLLGEKRVPESHLKSILAVEETRNSYVHYKWKPHLGADRARWNTLLNNLRRAVRYLKAYEDRVLYGGRRKDIDRVLNAPFRASRSAVG